MSTRPLTQQPGSRDDRSPQGVTPGNVVQPGRLKFGRLDAALDAVSGAIGRARDLICAKQHPGGYWCGELEADSMLEADYIFIHTLLGTGDPGRLSRALTEMLRYQNDDGGWSIYPGGTSNISLAVKCYFA